MRHTPSDFTITQKLMRGLFGPMDGPIDFSANGCGEGSGFSEYDGPGAGGGEAMVYDDFSVNNLVAHIVPVHEGTGAGNGYGESSLDGIGHGDGMADFYEGFDNYGYGCDVGAAYESGAGRG